MSEIRYVEDVFSDFFNIEQSLLLDDKDRRIIYSFFSNILNGTPLTEKQGRLLITFLKKYRRLALAAGLDYQETLDNPVWKVPFRIIDLSKRLSIEVKGKKIWLCAKFPFALKEQFEQDIVPPNKSLWDHDNKVRKVELRDVNLISLIEFAKNNEFEIDDAVFELQSQVEEIWNQEETISKFSKIVDGQVILENASNGTIEYFEKNAKNEKYHDMFLAKTMGYPLKHSEKNTSPIEKISSSTENMFWHPSFSVFFDLYQKVGGKACVILDRNSEILEFLTIFVSKADDAGIPRSDIKVCFREDGAEKLNLNQWIKENEVGGQVGTGKLFIFAQKPAKWLFKDDFSVKIIATNLLYPDPNNMVRDWLTSHPCVLYVGGVRPSTKKEETVVEL